jgi:DNA ligase-1
MKTQFRNLATLCEKLENTKKRNLMVELVAKVLVELDSREVKPAIGMILGQPFPSRKDKKLEISWSTIISALKDLVKLDWNKIQETFSETGDLGSTIKSILEKNQTKIQSTLVQKPLTILEVEKTFETLAQIKGLGSKKQKQRIIKILFSNSTPLEVKYLVKIFIKEMRTGFHHGLMLAAISKAFNINEEAIRRANMIFGDLAEVAEIAKKQGKNGIVTIKIKVFRPIKPMLAQTTQSTEEAIKEHNGKTAFEFKLDGARIQIHFSKSIVKIFSRSLKEITNSFPDIVNLIIQIIKENEVILDGEIIAIGKDGNPLQFQHLMRRFRRIHKIKEKIEKIPVKLVLFDLLYLNGESLINKSYFDRRKRLERLFKNNFIVKQKIISNPSEADAFLKDAIENGHEGLVAKKLESYYNPGVRGKSWFKIKTSLEYLDLVIVAAEYGYGRRHSWLSNYYLAALNQETEEFQLVGKTFKGLSDEEMIKMTKKLKELTIKKEGRRVIVQPKVVVEVAYNEIQDSSKYKSEMALRFARITRIRKDKSPQEVDSIENIRRIYYNQFTKKAKYKNNKIEKN